jgi:hypothetical protein
MSHRLYILFVFIALSIAAFKMPGPLRERLVGPNNSTDISFSENKETASLTASYPKNRSKGVHEYIRNYFGLGDQVEMSALHVKRYQTPDGSMQFGIKSKDGYLKITLNKTENSREAYVKLRGAVVGLKSALVGNPK